MIKKVIKRQENSEGCFICGRKNEFSMNADFFELEDGSVAGFITVDDRYQSFPGVVHGGVVTALIDEIAGRAHMALEPGEISMTLELTTKYKKPVTSETPLLLIGRVKENRAKVCIAEGFVFLPGGELAATGEGVYYKLSKERLEAMGAQDEMMALYPSDNEPTEIDVPDILSEI